MYKKLHKAENFSSIGRHTRSFQVGKFCNSIVTPTSSFRASAALVLLTVEGKSVPLQAWTGPEVSRKLRFPDFVTTAQDGGKVVSLTHRPPLPPQEILLVLISVRG